MSKEDDTIYHKSQYELTVESAIKKLGGREEAAYLFGTYLAYIKYRNMTPVERKRFQEIVFDLAKKLDN